MKILRARIRGLGDTIESGWFELSPRLNLFHLPEEKERNSFLRALATINPLLPCERTKPFADFPQVSKRDGFSKRIFPEKRTVALAIFSTTPELVSDLAAVSPHLFEADRIEVGRRLDYSRWISFVEIASSARWCEIADDLQHLLTWTARVAPEQAANIASLTRTLSGSDRIKEGIASILMEWLQSLPIEIKASSKSRIDNLVKSVRRAEDFHAARRLVEQRLPILALFAGSPTQPDPVATLIERIRDGIHEPDALPLEEEHDLLAGLNHHLADMPFAGPLLHLSRSAKGGEIILSSRPALAATTNFSLPRLQAAVFLAIALSRVQYRTEPVLLFDSPERFLSAAVNRQLGEFLQNIAEFCQICYGYAAANIFSHHKGLPKYTVAELIRS